MFVIEYIAGWLAFKFKKTNQDFSVSRRPNLPSYVTDHTYAQCIGVSSKSWIDSMSYGGLTKPSEELLQWVEKLEKEFDTIHGNEFGERSNVMKDLISTLASVCQHVPLEVIKLYSKFRIYARCRFLNKKRLEAAILKKIEKRRIKALKVIEGLKVIEVTEGSQFPIDDLSRSKRKKMKKIIK